MGGEYVLVRSISAIVCARCGQQSVSPLTADRARMFVTGGAAPSSVAAINVFNFTP